jgi:hypothetical protein
MRVPSDFKDLNPALGPIVGTQCFTTVTSNYITARMTYDTIMTSAHINLCVLVRRALFGHQYTPQSTLFLPCLS